LNAPRAAAAPDDRTGPAGPVLFGATAFLLVFAPLARGGDRPPALIALELAALAILVVLALAPIHHDFLARLPATLRWALALLLVYPLLQLVPLPIDWWFSLPGHAPYAHVLEIVGGESRWRPLTIHPAATQYAWLALLPCVAMFLAVQTFERQRLRRLSVLFAIVCAVEALLGILQAGSPPGSLVHLGNRFSGGAATGTYVNKNHFAALMAMGLPIMLQRWAIEMLPTVNERGEVVKPHPRGADRRLALRIVLSASIVLALLALLLTRSRAGIGSGLAAFALAALAIVGYAGTVGTRVALGIVGACALALAAYVGLTPILERFAPSELTQEFGGRAGIAAATVRAALDFLPFGSGLGTFGDVFRRYQGTEHLIGFIDHAHDDYVEAFLELGVVGLAVIALALAAYALRWRQVLRERRQSLGYLRVAAGLGVAALIVHSAFDFNLHIPANAIYFSFLAGLFFAPRRAPPTPAAAPA
jgi:O-antigen ligase